MQFGRYEVERELGRGGMGVVYRARAADGATVAIKVLISAESARHVGRFDREMRLLRELGADNGFVPLIEVGESPAGPYLVMPFLGGGTLRDRLRRGPLTIDETVALGRTLAAALGRAHAKGIVHRDLKPENVLFPARADGSPDLERPLVADLGLAKHAAVSEQSRSLTKTGDMAGSLGYMAPEQLHDARRAGPPADVFSLAVVLYECIAGVGPFDADTPLGLVGRVSSGKFERLRSLQPETPAWLATVIESGLALDPQRRPRDGSELARRLEAPAVKTGSSSRLVVVAAVLGIAAIAAVVGLWLAPMRPREPAPPTPSLAPSARPVRRPTPLPTPTPSPLTRIPADYESLATSTTCPLVGVWGEPDAIRDANSLSLSEDGTRLLVGHSHGVVRLWDVAANTIASQIQLKVDKLNKVRLSRDARFAVSVHYGGGAEMWEVGRDASPFVVRAHPHNAIAAAITRDDKTVLTGGDEGKILRWDLARCLAHERVEPDPFETDASWTCEVALSPTEDRLAVANQNGLLQLYPFPQLRDPISFATPSGGMRTTAFLPVPDGIAGGDQAGEVFLFDVEKRRSLWRVSLGDKSAVKAISGSSDGRFIAAATENDLAVIELPSGRVLEGFDLAAAHDKARDLTFLPGGHTFLVATQRGVVLRFELVR